MTRSFSLAMATLMCVTLTATVSEAKAPKGPTSHLKVSSSTILKAGTGNVLGSTRKPGLGLGEGGSHGPVVLPPKSTTPVTWGGNPPRAPSKGCGYGCDKGCHHECHYDYCYHRDYCRCGMPCLMMTDTLVDVPAAPAPIAAATTTDDAPASADSSDNSSDASEDSAG